MNQLIQNKLMRVLTNPENHLAMAYLFLQNHPTQYQHILENNATFTSFFTMLTTAIKYIYVEIGNKVIQYTGKCQLCTEFQSKFNQKYILHLLVAHSNYKCDFIFYTSEQGVHIKLNALNQSHTPDYFNWMQVVQPQELPQYLIATLFMQSKCTVKQQLRKPQAVEQLIQDMISEKKFYNGPHLNFRPINSVQEFLSVDPIDYEFSNENEMQCLYKSTPQFKESAIQTFMEYYNAEVMLKKPTDLVAFLKQFTKLKGDQLVCLQNHLFVMLSYGLIDQGTFCELSLQIYKYSVNENDDPLFHLLPIQPQYKEYMDQNVQKLESQSLFQESMNAAIPTLKQSREDKRMRKQAQMQQLTDGWFGMKQQSQDDDAKHQFLLLKLKKYIDPKQTAKSQDLKSVPKYFQMGTYVNGGDNYGLKQKITKKKGHNSLVDQFIDFDNNKSVSRNKFSEIQSRQQRVSRINQKLKKLKGLSKRTGRARK